MTFKELKEQLEKFNENQLSKDVIVWSTNDGEFFDADFQEIMIASDQLDDEDAGYLVI
jgi:hypothetical protein